MADLYSWTKAVHVMAVIAWLAGLFYLPRLFVYHRREPVGTAASETFKVMEDRLARIIMAPAMAISWILGLALVWRGGWALPPPAWLIVKVIAVLLLSAVHGLLLRHLREFRADRRPRSERYFRTINEVPTLLMAVIVVMVIVKPW